MIYIHIPFCRRKCIYCAFYSVGASSADRQQAYVEALAAEMSVRRTECSRAVRTLYLGGGTPSLLPVEQLDSIVEALRRHFDLSALEEATLECNPDDLTADYLADLRSLRVFNRLSIGVQSLDDGMLRLLGRRHTARQALDAVRMARAAGFDNISVDFIYGLPLAAGVGGLDALGNIAAMLPEVQHVSAYALSVEPRTALARQVERAQLELPGDEAVVAQYHALRARLAAAGFEQYEVSSYARPHRRSRHNSRYWDRTPYLGLGAGAHSFDGRCRSWNVADVAQYIAALCPHDGGATVAPRRPYGMERLTDADAFNELLMTALRTTEGLPLASVPTGQQARLHQQMQHYVACGWIEPTPTHYRPTPEGLLHADGMAAALFI